jgi:hypothetical protein
LRDRPPEKKGEEPERVRKTGDLRRDGMADAAVLYTIEGRTEATTMFSNSRFS